MPNQHTNRLLSCDINDHVGNSSIDGDTNKLFFVLPHTVDTVYKPTFVALGFTVRRVLRWHKDNMRDVPAWQGFGGKPVMHSYHRNWIRGKMMLSGNEEFDTQQAIRYALAAHQYKSEFYYCGQGMFVISKGDCLLPD